MAIFTSNWLHKHYIPCVVVFVKKSNTVVCKQNTLNFLAQGSSFILPFIFPTPFCARYRDDVISAMQAIYFERFSACLNLCKQISLKVTLYSSSFVFFVCVTIKTKVKSFRRTTVFFLKHHHCLCAWVCKHMSDIIQSACT